MGIGGGCSPSIRGNAFRLFPFLLEMREKGNVIWIRKYISASMQN